MSILRLKYLLSSIFCACLAVLSLIMVFVNAHDGEFLLALAMALCILVNSINAIEFYKFHKAKDE